MLLISFCQHFGEGKRYFLVVCFDGRLNDHRVLYLLYKPVVYFDALPYRDIYYFIAPLPPPPPPPTLGMWQMPFLTHLLSLNETLVIAYMYLQVLHGIYSHFDDVRPKSVVSS